MTQMLTRAIGKAIAGVRTSSNMKLQTSRVQVGFGSWIWNDSDAYQGNGQSHSWRDDEQCSGRLWKLDKE